MPPYQIKKSSFQILRLKEYLSLYARIEYLGKSLRVTKNAYFSLSTHIKQLLLRTFCDKNAGIGLVLGNASGNTDERTNVEVEMVI